MWLAVMAVPWETRARVPAFLLLSLASLDYNRFPDSRDAWACGCGSRLLRLANPIVIDRRNRRNEADNTDTTKSIDFGVLTGCSLSKQSVFNA